MTPQLIDEINNLTSAIEDKNGIAEALIRFSNQLINAAKEAAHEADIERDYSNRVGEDE